MYEKGVCPFDTSRLEFNGFLTKFLMANKENLSGGTDNTSKPDRSTEELLNGIDQALVDQIERVRGRAAEPIRSIRDLRTCQGRN